MPRSISRIALAVAIGLVTSGGLFAFMSRPQAATAAAPPTIPVVVVKVNIASGIPLEATFVAIERRPASYVPEGAFTEPTLALGRVAKSDMVPGEALVESRLYPPGRAGPKTTLPVPAGKRAVTVAVDEVVGVAGFVMPGSLVDVVGTLDVDGQATTRVLLQKIQVLAIAQDAKKKDDPEVKIVTSATLAVTPEDSQILVLAADRGKIRLAMCGANEPDSAMLQSVTPSTLLGLPKKVATARSSRTVTPTPALSRSVFERPEGPPAGTILVIRGTATEVVTRADRY